MKTVTFEQLMKFNAPFLYNVKEKRRLWEITSHKKEWTALDVLALEEVNMDNRLWAVFRYNLVDRDIIYEFECLCAEHALTIAGITDKRFWNVIEVKRAWMRGEATVDELKEAADTAIEEYISGDVPAMDFAMDTMVYVSRHDAYHTAQYSALTITWCAGSNEERSYEYSKECAWQIEALKRLIMEAEHENGNG